MERFSFEWFGNLLAVLFGAAAVVYALWVILGRIGYAATQRQLVGTEVRRNIHRLILAGTLLLAATFILSEIRGLVVLADLVFGAIGNIPSFIGDIIKYFEDVPGEQLQKSLVVGALFGAVTTGLVGLIAKKRLLLPEFTMRAWSYAVVGVAVGFLFSLGLWYALLLGLAVLLATSIILDSTLRDYLHPDSFKPLFSTPSLRILGMGLPVGAIVGAISSQILMYPTQHCTYIDGAPRLEYRFGLLVTAGSALLILLPVWALLFKDRTTIKEVSTSGYFRNPVLPYLFLSPTLFILIVFLYYPGSQVLTLSTKLKRFPLPQERFSCMANYVKLTEDPIYQNSFSATIFFTVMIVILSMFLALMIAILASQKIKGASVYRSLLIWPYAISPVVTAIVFLTMFREGGAGLINYALDNLFGLEPRWLTDTDLAPWVVILAAVWNSLGFNILFYIAGLQNVPEDLLEAASIDGANRIQKFIRITFPLLSPFTFFLLITNITYSFYGIYGAVEALTQGGPTLGAGGKDGGATNVLIYKLYQDAFVNGRSGEAAAQALILFLMVAGLTVLQFRFVERRVTYSG